MKYWPTFFTIVLFSTSLFSQNEFIRGPEFLCGPQDSVEYRLVGFNPTDPMDVITWTIEPGPPSAEIASAYQDIAIVNFYSPGFYTLTATYRVDMETRVTEHYISMNDFFSEAFVQGCTESSDSLGCYQVCTGSESSIFLESPSGTTAIWTVTGAESYTDFGDRVEIIWGSPGMGTVSYFTECNGEGSLCFDILPVPIADFDLIPDAMNQDTVTICRGQEIYFENTSQHGLTYNWYFGDGEESESYDAIHAYNETGFFIAKLVAGSVCDCSDEKEIVFEVLDAPAPTLDCVNSVCPETRQTYTATTDGCTVFNWSISGNGTIVNGGESTDDFIEVIWHDGPDGIINLSVSNCTVLYCSSSNTFRVPIITPDGPVEGDQSVCSGEIATYTAPYFPGTVYNWQVSSRGRIMGNPGSNAVTVRWDQVNTLVTDQVVSVNYENCFLECGGEDNISVQITPLLSISGDAQVCQGDEASCSALFGFNMTSPADVQWQIRDEDENILFASSGLLSTFNHVFNYPSGNYYWIGLNNSPDYCNEEIRQRISVTERPTSPLGIDGDMEICPGLEYGYNIIPAGEYETSWTVTDGANTINYQGQIISHIFGNTPPYIIEARHIDVQFPDCDSGPISIALTSAADEDIVGNAEACYQSIESYSIDFVGGAEYEWEILPADHGEILAQSSNTIDVFWSQSGPATVRLSVCGVVKDFAVTVYDLPVFSVIGPTEICRNEQGSFSTDQATLDHQWKDEDGNVIGSNPTIDLPPGFYSVTLTDALGCSYSEQFNLRIIPSPRIQISSPDFSYSCTEDPILLVANTDGVDYSFVWYRDGVMLGTGSIITGPGFGLYEVEVTNQYGCVVRSSGFLYGECCPISDCQRGDTRCSPSCALLSYDFDTNITDVSCSDKSYQILTPVEAGSESWIIRQLDEEIAFYSGNDVAHSYNLPGYYRIITRARLVGFSYPESFCFHYEISKDSVIMVADYDVNMGCAGDETEFEDLTTFLPGHGIGSWSWDFGDPASGVDNISSAQNPRHVYNSSGTYTVILTATSTTGCTSEMSQQISISDGPDLIIDYDVTNCQDEATSFNLLGNVFSPIWDFDDPVSGTENTAEATHVFHTYTIPNNYVVDVSAEDVYGCSSSTQVPVEIHANTLAGDIDVQLSNQFCQGESATLTAPAGGVSWEWSNQELTESITVTNSDNYSVYIRDQFNCSYTAPAEFIEVLPKPVVVVRARVILGPGEYGPWEDSLEVCDDVDFEIHAISIDNLNYSWVGGQTGSILVFAGDGGGFPGPGTHVFTVSGVNPVTNCPADDQSITVVIHDLPNFPTINLVGSGCSFDDNVLSVTNVQPNVRYVWSDGQQGSEITAIGAGDYFVTAINEFGCEQNSNTRRINASAPVDQLPAGCHIACDPLTVCLPPLSNVASYIIYQNGVSWMTGTNWPGQFIADQDGSYTIEVTSTNGCVATSDPLDVLLYQGTGVITVSTYVDVDNDGAISAADTLIGGIYVDILSADGLHEGHTSTESNGRFDFVDYPNSTYIVSIDQDRLLPTWLIVLDSLNANINTCGDSVNVSLLLSENCQVIGPDLMLELCPGDSITIGDQTWSDTGHYELNYVSVDGCDSLINVEINLPDSFTISLNVWFDVDQSELIGTSDTLMSGIAILITDINSGEVRSAVTDGNGQVSASVPVGDYEVKIDLNLLPSTLDTIIWIDTIYGAALCGDESDLVLDFLLGGSCEITSVPISETICFGDSLSINGIWQTEPGLYTYISEGPQCDTTIDFTLEVIPEFVVSSDVIYDCEGLASIFISSSGVGPYTYQWVPNVSTDSMAINVDIGSYEVTVIDTNLCSAVVEVGVVAQPTLSFSLDTLFEITEGESVVLDITGSIDEPGLHVSWQPVQNLTCSDCFNPSANPSQTTEYQVVITDVNGCIYELSTRIEVTPLSKVYVPDAFTPDDDGLNDTFRVMSDDEGAIIAKMSIFNRWGDVMYHEENIPIVQHQGWNGRYNGDEIASQVVIYMIEIMMSDGRVEMIHGDVTLIR